MGRCSRWPITEIYPNVKYLRVFVDADDDENETDEKKKNAKKVN